jgi:hypothetical protein
MDLGNVRAGPPGTGETGISLGDVAALLAAHVAKTTESPGGACSANLWDLLGSHVPAELRKRRGTPRVYQIFTLIFTLGGVSSLGNLGSVGSVDDPGSLSRLDGSSSPGSVDGPGGLGARDADKVTKVFPCRVRPRRLLESLAAHCAVVGMLGEDAAKEVGD